MAIQTVIGFDYGERRIGVATGQTITASATPLVTLNAVKQKPDWLSIEKIIAQWQPEALIVGLPVYLHGGDSEMTEKARRFSRQLEGRFHLPVHLINESLTSFAAEQHLTKKNQHNKQEIDKIAAAIIVQSWLEQNA
jgi:putative Holliday junction resolvase